MCEITSGKIYVADRDLVCYKVMLKKGEQLESIHKRYEYEIGREYCVNGFEYKCCMTNDIIYEGWHLPLSPFGGWRKYYTTCPNMYKNATGTDLCHTCCGFYSYTYYGNGKMESDFNVADWVYGLDMIKIVRCIIPEGSKYVVSEDGEIFISEKIVIDDAWSL